MEPDLRDEQVKVIDTGQSSTLPSPTTVTAPVPPELSAGEGFVNNEDGQGDSKVAVTSSSKSDEDFFKHVDDISTTSQSSVSSLSDNKEAAQGSDSPESLRCSDVSQEDFVKKVETKPKIFIGMEDEDPREIGSSNDEDMDPLITVDDTESQISDMINFDTVSYDVIHQLGDDEDDDEKSIATVSSLSCDMKMDSPSSQHSNSSSLVNLLDSSFKETTGVNVCSSSQIQAEGMRSTGSSCPSSPVLHSSKTASSVVDEASTNLLPENEVGADVFDQLSEVNASAVQADSSKDQEQKNVPTTPEDKVCQKNAESDPTGVTSDICASIQAAKQDTGTEPLLSLDETVPDSTTTATVDEECVSESDLLPECDQKSGLIFECSSNCLEESPMKPDQALPLEEDTSSSTLLVAESNQNVSVSLKNLEENSQNTAGDTCVDEERSPSPEPSFNNSSAGTCFNEVCTAKPEDDTPEVVFLAQPTAVSSSTTPCNETNSEISPKVSDPSQCIDGNTLNSPVEPSLDEEVSSSDMSEIVGVVGRASGDLTPISKSAEGRSRSSSVQQECNEEMLSLSENPLDKPSIETEQDSLKACDLPTQSQVCDKNISSTSETLLETILTSTSEDPALNTCIDKASPNSSVQLNQSPSSEEATSTSKIEEDLNATFVSSLIGEEDMLTEKIQDESASPVIENNVQPLLAAVENSKPDISDTQAVKVNSPEHGEQDPPCEVTESEIISSSSDSTDEKNAEDNSPHVISTELSKLQEGLCKKFDQTFEEVHTPQASEGNNNPQNYIPSETVCEGETEDCISFQNHLQSSLRPDKILESELNPEVHVTEANRLIECQDFPSAGFTAKPHDLCEVEDSLVKLNALDLELSHSGGSCNYVPNCNCDTHLPTVDCSTNHSHEMKSLDTKLQETESSLKYEQIPPSAIDNLVRHPTSLPHLKPSNLSSPNNLGGMNFSDFLSLMSPASLQKATVAKQYSVTALDEAQQTACYIVDDVLQKAVLKVEEIISFRTSVCDNAVKTAQSIVSDILIEAVAQSLTERNGLKEKEEASSASESPVSTPSETEAEQVESVTESVTKGVITLSNSSSEVDLGRFSSEIVSPPVQESSNQSLAEAVSKEESARSSPETIASDSARSSLLTCSLRSEASLFVDGVLEEAAKKYDESSSSESSPVKLKALVLDSEYQDDEELATPCGEMLTEHFMDFESGRNVSVFCSIPESGANDHFMACDRVANTIGNREVDSDTGKSLSVFRIEEDIFYEIQRASTCTSVFESVEEEDEDMIDTTLPLEDRPDMISQASVSSTDSNTDNQNVADEQFRTDNDAFEDAVGAFLTKERQTRDEVSQNTSEEVQDTIDQQHECSQLVRRNPFGALVLKHPEYDLSNQEEKKKMAEKWANGGESTVPDTPEMHAKQRAIREALDSDEDPADVAVKLCQLALTEGGLINDELRKEAWPRMLGLDPSLEIDAPSLEDLKEHPEYGQVVLDVNRSLKRFPPDIPKDRRETLQDKLTRLIMYVISKHPHLRYYQGYHDVAVTFLLVVGESVAFQIMERLSTENLSDCMQPTMERTSYLLHFIYPLLHRLHPTLADYLERSEVGTMFCLPWFLTWFGHSLDRYQDVVRLYDHFLASPPLAPLYVAAVLVAHRADEVLAVDCDMAAIHALLSHIPDTLPLEILLRDATDLYLKFPPESIEREVEERFKNEQEMRVHEVEAREKLQRQRALRRRRGHSTGSGSWQLAEFQDRVGGTMMVLNRWMPPWVVQQQRLSVRLLFASATFFVGFYVYSRGGDMLPYL